jgi:hypothetical protein
MLDWEGSILCVPLFLVFASSSSLQQECAIVSL